MGIIKCWLLLLGLFSVQQHAGGSKENLSRRGTATLSTTASSQSANRAIDGGKDSSTYSSSCATTNDQSKPWWRLDLQAAYRVNTVVVTYRDDSVPGQTKDIQVKFGNSLWSDGNSNPRCAVISSDSAANSFTYSCSGQEGRYVNVFHNDWWDFLSVCEVEVYETDAPVGCHGTVLRLMIIKRENGCGLKEHSTFLGNRLILQLPPELINSSRRSFMKMTFNATANLTDPTVTDNVLEELKSALAVRGITNVTLSWSQTPEEVVIQKEHENDPC